MLGEILTPKPAEIPYKVLYPACAQTPCGIASIASPEITVLSFLISVFTSPENLLLSKKPKLSK